MFSLFDELFENRLIDNDESSFLKINDCKFTIDQTSEYRYIHTSDSPVWAIVHRTKEMFLRLVHLASHPCSR